MDAVGEINYLGAIQYPESGTPEDVLQKAIDELCTKLGCEPKDVSLQSCRSVMWGDSSLGLPESGYYYTQVLTPGYQLVLKKGSDSFAVNTNEDGTAVKIRPSCGQS